jgi:hypothetical protein
VNAAELELRAPAHRQPFHFAAHFHYGSAPDAPVVAVLWFEGTPISGGVVDETGQVVSASVATERFASPYAGWFLWLVAEPPCPRTWLGPDAPLTDVVKAAVKLIADAPEPTFDLEESKALLVDLLYSREPDFLLPFPTVT